MTQIAGGISNDGGKKGENLVYQKEKVLVMQNMQDTLYDYPRSLYVAQGACI